MPLIGFLSSRSPHESAGVLGAFHLAETGYSEGRNISIEYRWAEVRYDRLQALAEDPVRLKVTSRPVENIQRLLQRQRHQLSRMCSLLVSAQKGVSAPELDRFLDEIEATCRKAGIAIEVGQDKRIYCLGVKLKDVSAEPVCLH